MSVEPCDYGMKRAFATIEIDGLGEIEIDYFTPAKEPPFVAARSILQKYDGAYIRTTRLTDEFAAELREALEARLAVLADDERE